MRETADSAGPTWRLTHGEWRVARLAAECPTCDTEPTSVEGSADALSLLGNMSGASARSGGHRPMPVRTHEELTTEARESRHGVQDG